jgi:hypothetical protein
LIIASDAQKKKNLEQEVVTMKELLMDFWKSAGKKIRILSEDEKDRIWDAVRKKYLRPDVHIGYSICDALNYSLISSSRGTDSWRCIGDFIKNNTVILFFNKDWGGDFYEIENGSMFVKFYDEECGGIEFYITDSNTNFLFAYNQAQCLVAMGTAREWLSSYKNK